MKVSQQWPYGYRGRRGCHYDGDEMVRGIAYPSKYQTLCAVEPFVQYGLREAQYTSVEHAMREVAAITYLMGMGYDPRTAHRIVESWEVNERF